MTFKLPSKILLASHLVYVTICSSNRTLKSAAKSAVKDWRVHTINSSNCNQFGDVYVQEFLKRSCIF